MDALPIIAKSCDSVTVSPTDAFAGAGNAVVPVTLLPMNPKGAEGRRNRPGFVAGAGRGVATVCRVSVSVPARWSCAFLADTGGAAAIVAVTAAAMTATLIL